MLKYVILDVLNKIDYFHFLFSYIFLMNCFVYKMTVINDTHY